MPLFDYVGYDSGGEQVRGRIEGSGRRAALLQLHSNGIFATELTAGGQRRSGWLERLRGPNVDAGELAAITRQGAVLLAAGLTLDATLAALAAQGGEGRLGRALTAARERVLQGEALHMALRASAPLFSAFYLSMVQVGESSGTLAATLHRLADFLDNQARLRSRIVAALTYPALMLAVGSSVLIVLVTFVVPGIVRMLDELGRTLPLPTRLLIALSHLFTAYGWLLLLVAIAGLLGLRHYLRTPAGARQRDALLLRLPLLGPLATQLAIARFARTLGVLLQSGMPLLPALALTRQLVANRLLQELLDRAAIAVREGESLAQALRTSPLLPPLVAQLIAVGEQSGELEGMLQRLADTYEGQLELSSNRLLALLEPLLILLMGGAVGFIVIAILLPIFEASQGLG